MSAKPLRGVHVAWMAGGFCAALFALNGYFLSMAIDSFPGEVAEKSYLQGLEYNATLERRAAQKGLGWSAEIGLVGQDLIVRVLDRSGAPVPDLSVTAESHVPGRAEAAHLLLPSSATPGEYVVPVDLSGAPLVEVRVEARKPGVDEVVFEALKTLRPALSPMETAG